VGAHYERSESEMKPNVEEVRCMLHVCRRPWFEGRCMRSLQQLEIRIGFCVHKPFFLCSPASSPLSSPSEGKTGIPALPPDSSLGQLSAKADK